MTVRRTFRSRATAFVTAFLLAFTTVFVFPGEVDVSALISDEELQNYGNRQIIPTFSKSQPCGTIKSEKIHKEGEMVNGSMEKGDRGIQTQRKKSEGMVCGKRNKTQYTEILA